jgi:hypothetical protein
MAKLTSQEIRDAAHAAALRALDKNKDGRVDRQDAQIMASSWESRFPIGTILLAFTVGAILGALVA